MHPAPQRAPRGCGTTWSCWTLKFIQLRLNSVTTPSLWWPSGDWDHSQAVCILKLSLSFYPGCQGCPDASKIHVPFTELRRTGSLLQCILATFVRLGSKVFACSPWNQWVLLKHALRPQEVLRSKWAQFTSSTSALKQQHLLHLIKLLFVESSEQPQLSHFSSSPPPQTTGDIILQGFYKLYLEITSFL